jgi:DNA adenine methylase
VDYQEGEGVKAVQSRGTYTGAKGQPGVIQRIVGQMPPHPVYVEAFAGSGTVLRAKRPAAQSIAIERDPRVCAALAAAVGGAVKVLHGDALTLLPTLDLPPEAVVYCDPPYLAETRAERLLYDFEFATAQEHASLLALLQRLPCRVLLSGYPSPLYAERLAGWRCLSYRTRTRGKTVTECLWCNFPEPEELHDWRFAGRSFRERLALRRMAERWLARLDALPARKRGFLTHAISQRAVPRYRPAGVPHGLRGDEHSDLHGRPGEAVKVEPLPRLRDARRPDPAGE